MLSYEPAGAVSTLVVLPARAAHAVSIFSFFCVLDDTGAKCGEGNNAICSLKESVYKMCPAG
jgi:hypothetical protein